MTYIALSFQVLIHLLKAQYISQLPRSKTQFSLIPEHPQAERFGKDFEATALDARRAIFGVT